MDTGVLAPLPTRFPPPAHGPRARGIRPLRDSPPDPWGVLQVAEGRAEPRRGPAWQAEPGGGRRDLAGDSSSASTLPPPGGWSARLAREQSRELTRQQTCDSNVRELLACLDASCERADSRWLSYRESTIPSRRPCVSLARRFDARWSSCRSSITAARLGQSLNNRRSLRSMHKAHRKGCSYESG